MKVIAEIAETVPVVVQGVRFIYKEATNPAIIWDKAKSNEACSKWAVLFPNITPDAQYHVWKLGPET